MVNAYRGEVAIDVNGETQVMRLTLGALASLEARLESGSLVALVSRFEEGSFRAADLAVLISAGLGMEEDEVLRAEFGGGPMAAARAAAQLLKVTFALPEAEESQ
ncbi:gene transfer agent family protein [Algicella marina]|uniref:Gene transfer agent family protein n=1 Tax=Algicella marina TaxID=2683284 RepID=A0A6P1T655_9RHOB|nr:gene transfer agent family protein [Algicella marina]QHQ37291.1 gene transfer agent family protein [Algicella marina]